MIGIFQHATSGLNPLFIKVLIPTKNNTFKIPEDCKSQSFIHQGTHSDLNGWRTFMLHLLNLPGLNPLFIKVLIPTLAEAAKQTKK